MARRGRPASRCRSAPDGTRADALWFATANPAYLDKNNASAIHAALRLDTRRARARLRRRAAIGRRRAARRARRQRHRARGRVRHARRPADERRRVAGRRRRGRDPRRRRRRRPGHRRVPRRAAARPRSSSSAGARRASRRSRAWEERFGEVKYAPLVEQAWNARAEGGRALARPGRPARSSPACTPARCAASPAGSARRRRRLVDDLAATVGNTGTAHAALLLAERARDGRARPGDRARRARRRRRRAAVPHHRRDRVVPAGAHGRDADRRRRADRLRQVPLVARHGHARAAAPAEPDRISASVSGRSEEWKYGVRRLARPRAAASCTCRRRGSRASATRSTTWSRRRWPTSRARSRCSRSTASRTRRARRSRSRSSTSTAAAACRSSSPTSTSTTLQIGDRVEMTFRKLFTADDIHNYFWKARPVRS